MERVEIDELERLADRLGAILYKLSAKSLPKNGSENGTDRGNGNGNGNEEA